MSNVVNSNLEILLTQPRSVPVALSPHFQICVEEIRMVEHGDIKKENHVFLKSNSEGALF